MSHQVHNDGNRVRVAVAAILGTAIVTAWMPQLRAAEAKEAPPITMGHMVQRLLETVDLQAIHIGVLTDRLTALEARLSAAGL